MAGIIIVVLCFFFFANLVWNIEVIGANQTIAKEIINVLNENNIKMPSTLGSLNEKHIETLIHKNFNHFKFVEAYVEGSKLIIFVKEKEMAIAKESDKIQMAIYKIASESIVAESLFQLSSSIHKIISELIEAKTFTSPCIIKKKICLNFPILLMK